MKKPECDYENWDGTKYEEDKAMWQKMEANNTSCLHHSFSPRAKKNYDGIDWSKGASV